MAASTNAGAAPLRHLVDRWLFQLRGAEPLPVVLGQRRVFVLPTSAGWMFALTLLFLLIGSINYSLSLGYVLTFILAGLGVTAILHTFRNLAQLRIAAGRCEPAFAGEQIGFQLILHNDRAEPRRGLVLRLAGGQSNEADVPGRGSTGVSLATPARRRGWQQPGRLVVQTTYPLGLIRAWSYLDPDMPCLVYPRPEHGARLPAAQEGYDGGAPSAAGTEDFSGLRSHQPADSPRHIAWKAYAREAPLLTKQFRSGGTSILWLDWNSLPPAMDTEARLSRLTAQIVLANRAGVAFGLRMPAKVVPPAAGSDHVQACLKLLALHGLAAP